MLTDVAEVWHGVILQAIQDAVIEPDCQRLPERIARCEARHWLLRDDDDFPLVCNLAGFEPKTVRAAATTIINRADQYDKAKALAPITLARLRQVLDYDPDTGIFRWRIRPGFRFKPGDVAGTLERGYRVIRIDNRGYRASNLAWLYCYGEWPSQNVSYRDGNPLNVRLDNLVEVSNTRLRFDRKSNKSNVSGIKGVTFDRAKGRWLARIGVEGEVYYLGSYETKEAAAAALEHARTERLRDLDRTRYQLPGGIEKLLQAPRGPAGGGTCQVEPKWPRS